MSMIGNFVALSPDRLRALIDEPDSLEDFLYQEDGDEEPNNRLDLDKAWHAIHFTLNGKAWEGEEPLFLTILGGEEIGADVGYGPARYLLPDQVRAVAQALNSVSAENFAAKFDPSALAAAEVYPGIWDEGAEALEYVQSYYEDLRKFYISASERNDSVLIYLN